MVHGDGRRWRIVIAGLVLLLTGCGRQLYYVSVANYGEKGVILKPFPVQYDGITNIRPGIPGVEADIFKKGYFKGYPNSLPEKVEVVWQLAELKNCRDVVPSTSFVPHTTDTKVYTRKEGCEFVPIPGKVFRRVIDLDEVRNSSEAKNAGKRARDWWSSFSRNGLIVEFEFRDEALSVDTAYFHTNSWH